MPQKDCAPVGLNWASSEQSEEAENKDPDWGEIFTTIVSHTSITYEEILRRTIPQIEAVLDKLDRHIEIKIGMPAMGVGGASVERTESVPHGLADKAPKISDFMMFANEFNRTM